MIIEKEVTKEKKKRGRKKKIENKENKDIKVKLKCGRYREKNICFNVLRDGHINIHDSLKDKVTVEELSLIIYAFFEEVLESIINEGIGFEIPLSIGYIQISGTKETAYKLGDIPSKLNRSIIQPNYHTDGYVFKSWYRFTNNDSILKSKIGTVKNCFMYRFKSTTGFRRKMTAKIKSGEFRHWGMFNFKWEVYVKNPKKNYSKDPIKDFIKDAEKN